jgi:hypothetical protein
LGLNQETRVVAERDQLPPADEQIGTDPRLGMRTTAHPFPGTLKKESPMIELYMSVSGGMLGRELHNDPEELWYALVSMHEMAKENGTSLGQEMTEYAGQSDCENMAKFLREIADGLEKPDD